MKVAFIKPPLSGHNKRGTGEYARNLATALEEFTDTEVIQTDLSAIPKQIDLLHFPYFDPFFLTLPLKRPKTTVVTVHDLIPLKFPKHFPRGIKGELKWRIQKQSIRSAESIITDSDASKRDILQFTSVKENKVHVAYLAPNSSFLVKKTALEKNQVNEKYHLPKEFILYVGDVNWNKNVPMVIRAAQQVEIPLVLISNSLIERHLTDYNAWQDSLIEAQKEIQNGKNIYTLGRIDSDELSTMYQMAKGLLFPSFYEGFGLPVVEAFASGCPVITSTLGSLGEVAGDAAIYVNPYDLADITNGVQKILSDKALRVSCIEKGRERVKNFTWEKTAVATQKLYKSLLSQS